LYRDFDKFKSEFRKEFDELKASVTSGLPDTNYQPAASVIQEEVREAIEKEKKKLSAVIVGLPEVDIAKVRSDGDKQFVAGIAGKCGVDVAEIKDVFRDGKVREAEGDRTFCRIVKVKFETWAAKMSFIRSFKKSIPVHLKAYVRHDLTFREREAERALKKQLGKYREEFKDAEIVINRGRIVYKGTSQVFSPSMHNLRLLAPGLHPPGLDAVAAAQGHR
jgi:hypothetical protein